MSETVSTAGDYLAAQRLAELPASGSTWLDNRRGQARSLLEGIGLPTTRQEDWKYTNVRPITRTTFHPVSASCGWHDREYLESVKLPGLDSHRLVFADGILVPELSSCEGLPAGVTVTSVAEVLRADDARLEKLLGSALPSTPHGFTAMNSSFVADGAYLDIGPGTVLDKPVELLFICACAGEGRLGMPRNLIVGRPGSRARVIERYLSVDEARSLTNAVSEVILEEGAQLSHHRITDESSRSFHVGGLFAALDGDSRLDACSVTLGGSLVRNDVLVHLVAPGAAVDLAGLYLARGRGHIDNHTHVVHESPAATSRELYKGVLSDRSRAVFHGRITVQAGAQQTDSEQSNQNLLLSRDAEVDTKPQLEIYADDVKCSHGATVGQLDEMAVFYLRSRGMGESEARRMLTQAFAGEILERIDLESLRAYLDQCVSQRLASGDQIAP